MKESYPIEQCRLNDCFYSIFTFLICRRQGRPRKEISKERLEGLLRLKFPVSRIAQVLQVSRPRVYKAITEYNLDASRYSVVTDSDLQQAITSVKNNHPNAGEVMLQGHLRTQGIHVQRSRMRDAIRVTDPTVTARKRPAIRRRVYSVPCPNYLWHLDGNHKLITWRFVIHHCIDGFSRLVTFCRCSTNNRASTVVASFQEAVRKYGRPFRIRSDHGGENVDVWRDMVSAWGEEAKCVIVGSSVHNQRIERHNRAANEQELSVFKSDFYDLEREGILDPLNDTDLFCLHYVYLPRLNRNLAEFVSAHNNHKISTEESNTPAQLFWANLHLTAFGEGRDSQNAFRHVNISDLISTELPHVHVPETTNPLDHSSYRELQGLVNPLSGTNGKELYRRTVDFVGRALVRNPTTS